MKKVIAFGTFDIFHKGHESFLKQARKYGDFLCVVVARDGTVQKIKKKRAKNNEKTRLTEVKVSGLADKVILGNLRDKYVVIKKYKPDVICLGYDQNFFIDELENKLKSFGLVKTKIFRLKSYKPGIYKSSKIMMKNKKGFVGGLVSIIITVAIILGLYFWWQKMSVKNLQNTTQKASQEAGVEINTQDASPQGQVNAVRDLVGKVQNKENAKIENEMK